MLRRGFRVPTNAKEFPAAALGTIRAYRPDAFVAPLNIALMLAGEKLGGRFDLPSLEIAIAVVTRTDDAPLADHHRELLWQAFGVPVFEMLAAKDGATKTKLEGSSRGESADLNDYLTFDLPPQQEYVVQVGTVEKTIKTGKAGEHQIVDIVKAPK